MPIFVPKKSGKKYAHDMYCMYFNVISKWCEQECFIIIIGQLDGICFEKFTHRLCSYCDYHWLEQANTAARQQHTEYFCICVCIVKAAEELAVAAAAALRKFASTNSIKYNIALCVCVFFSLSCAALTAAVVAVSLLSRQHVRNLLLISTVVFSKMVRDLELCKFKIIKNWKTNQHKI